MRKEGTQFKCERCGRTAFFEGGGSFNETAGSIKWDIIRGMHFCDGCSDIFNKWFESFLNMKEPNDMIIQGLESKVRYLNATMKNENDMENLVEKTMSTFKVSYGMEEPNEVCIDEEDIPESLQKIVDLARSRG